MNEQSTVVVEISNEHAVVRLNRPDSRNAFNQTMRHELLNAVQRLNDHDAVRVVILAGNGRGFCAGADLAEQHPPGQTVDDRLNKQYKPLLLGIADSPKIWIASVHGAAAGIGASLALCCDLVVMEETAFFYQAFSAIGLIPDGGLSCLLQRQLGKKKAFEIFALGGRLTAAECLQYGVANRLATADGVTDTAVTLAEELLQRAPLSLRLTKQVMREVEQASLADAISAEAKLQLLASNSEDHQEGRRAFAEKRPPVWKGK